LIDLKNKKLTKNFGQLKLKKILKLVNEINEIIESFQFEMGFLKTLWFSL